jgi:hypothetical protein
LHRHGSRKLNILQLLANKFHTIGRGCTPVHSGLRGEKMLTIVIGDLHGMAAKLRNLLGEMLQRNMKTANNPNQ